MFYIRTADRLQRTAAWLEALDGGLDHLRAVIVDDSPRHLRRPRRGDGRATSATTPTSGAAVLDDPEKLARFVSFVNAPGCPTRVSVRRPNGASRCRSRSASRRSLTPMTADVTCPADALAAEQGVAALLPDGTQVAVFRTADGACTRVGNIDPFSGAGVLSRGIVGDRGGVPMVASPDAQAGVRAGHRPLPRRPRRGGRRRSRCARGAAALIVVRQP